MTKATFTLRIEMGDTVDPDFNDEILATAREYRETEDKAALRILSSMCSEAEDILNSLLPEGMYAKIEGGKIQ